MANKITIKKVWFATDIKEKITHDNYSDHNWKEQGYWLKDKPLLAGMYILDDRDGLHWFSANDGMFSLWMNYDDASYGSITFAIATTLWDIIDDCKYATLKHAQDCLQEHIEGAMGEMGDVEKTYTKDYAKGTQYDAQTPTFKVLNEKTTLIYDVDTYKEPTNKEYWEAFDIKVKEMDDKTNEHLEYIKKNGKSDVMHKDWLIERQQRDYKELITKLKNNLK